MAENGHLIAYLLVEKGTGDNKKTYWRPLGAAYPCRDGSINVKLDIHPGLTFNLRPPKSNGEADEINDTTFVCALCKRTNPNEDAHATYDNQVICETCFKDYKDCKNCDYCFPKVVKGSLCPNCRR